MFARNLSFPRIGLTPGKRPIISNSKLSATRLPRTAGSSLSRARRNVVAASFSFASSMIMLLPVATDTVPGLSPQAPAPDPAVISIDPLGTIPMRQASERLCHGSGILLKRLLLAGKVVGDIARVTLRQRRYAGGSRWPNRAWSARISPQRSSFEHSAEEVTIAPILEWNQSGGSQPTSTA